MRYKKIVCMHNFSKLEIMYTGTCATLNLSDDNILTEITDAVVVRYTVITVNKEHQLEDRSNIIFIRNVCKSKTCL